MFYLPKNAEFQGIDNDGMAVYSAKKPADIDSKGVKKALLLNPSKIQSVRDNAAWVNSLLG